MIKQMKKIGKATLYCADCKDVLPQLKDIDSCVTDPPYGLSFMGKGWDYDVPSGDIWTQVHDVLKPGAHLLSFFGSRTYHRGVIPIEDAGFEIRDQLMWLYGSGFPKSHNIGKAVDKIGGNLLGNEVAELVKKKRLEMGLSTRQLAELGKFYGKKNHGGTVSNWETGRGSITLEQVNKLIEILNLENNPIVETKRKVLGIKRNVNISLYQNIGGASTLGDIEITKGNSEWEGWGTALKPAHEPIVMARKPFKGNVAENVLQHGVGGINIDECRVGTESLEYRTTSYRDAKTGEFSGQGQTNHTTGRKEVEGRFPANVMHDGSDLVQDVFADKARYFYCAKASKKDRDEGLDMVVEKPMAWSNQAKAELERGNIDFKADGDNSKHNKVQMRKNTHPTVKPTELMRYLCRLVTPQGGVVLDPFMGSGSTGKAAVMSGYEFVGVEMEEEYFEIACMRIEAAQYGQGEMF